MQAKSALFRANMMYKVRTRNHFAMYRCPNAGGISNLYLGRILKIYDVNRKMMCYT